MVRKTLKSGELSESAIQKTVMEWVNTKRGLRNFVIHIPNEGKRTTYYGKSLKDMGMRPGVADLFIAMPKHGYHGAWIELKSKHGGLSTNQRDFLVDMMIKNYFATACFSIEDAIDTINWYCFKV
jgi:hypothetical protein